MLERSAGSTIRLGLGPGLALRHEEDGLPPDPGVPYLRTPLPDGRARFGEPYVMGSSA